MVALGIAAAIGPSTSVVGVAAHAILELDESNRRTLVPRQLVKGLIEIVWM